MGFFQRLLARLGYVKVSDHGYTMSDTGSLVRIGGAQPVSGTSVYTSGSQGRAAKAPLTSWQGHWNPMAQATPAPPVAEGSMTDYPPVPALGAYSPSPFLPQLGSPQPESDRPPGVPVSSPPPVLPGMGLNDLLMGRPAMAPTPRAPVIPMPSPAAVAGPALTPAPVCPDTLSQALRELDDSFEVTLVSQNSFAEMATVPRARGRRAPGNRFLGRTDAQCTLVVATEQSLMAFATKTNA